MFNARRSIIYLLLTICIMALVEMGYLLTVVLLIPHELTKHMYASGMNFTLVPSPDSMEMTQPKQMQLADVNGPLFKHLLNYERYCTAHFQVGWKHIPDILPPCPCLPHGLGGMAPLDNDTMVVWNISSIEALHPELLPGGAWKPTSCIARQRVAIIIPYRDRAAHLSIFLRHMHPILQRQRLEYRIFIIEQAAPEIFNKAALMNIGFVEAMKVLKFDCVIFHDIDLLAEDDRNMYTCRHDLVTHLAPFIDRWNYKILFLLFGAALAVTPEQFVKINGFSNTYWGWGGEDDDMLHRVKAAGYTYWRPSAAVGRYKDVKHQRDKGNPKNPQRIKAVKYRPADYVIDGLSAVNSSLYTVVNIKDMRLYTWIHVALNSTGCNLCSTGR